MKKCPACGHENSDEMNFCLRCGTSLAAPQIPDWQQKEEPTTVRQRSFETATFEKNFGAAAQPKSNKKLFIILGGIAALFLLFIVGGAAILGYNYLKRKQGGSDPTPSPTRTSESPTPTRSGSPTPSPSVNPTATPQVSFTPPTEATKKGTFTVYANSGWQLSDIDTVPLENFRTSAVGRVDLAGVKMGVSPGGVSDAKTKSRRLYPDFPTGALLMRTRYADGKYSNMQPVTASRSWQNFPDERGKLEFCINDNSPGQNGGQFTVTVTMTSVPKEKK